MDRKQHAAVFTETGKVVPTSSPAEVLPEPEKPLSANEVVIRRVSSWNGVTMHEHRFGGVEFRLRRRELGHLHSRFADLPFPRRLRDELVASGRARPHHVLPDSGWVTVPMRTASESENVIELFRQNYERGMRTLNAREEKSGEQ